MESLISLPSPLKKAFQLPHVLKSLRPMMPLATIERLVSQCQLEELSFQTGLEEQQPKTIRRSIPHSQNRKLLSGYSSSLKHWSQNLPQASPRRCYHRTLLLGQAQGHLSRFIRSWVWPLRSLRCSRIFKFYFKGKKNPVWWMNIFISLPADSMRFWLAFLITSFTWGEHECERSGDYETLANTRTPQKLDGRWKAHHTLPVYFGLSLDANNC